MDADVLTARWRQRLQQWLAVTNCEPAPRALETHGVLPLLDWSQPPMDPQLAAAARSARRELLAREALHAQTLRQIDAMLARLGVPGLVIKGEALAAGLYPASALRPRHDIDLWVRPEDLASVEAGCASVGATAVASASGRWIQPERLWRFAAGRARIGVDLHWQAVSRPALLPGLNFDHFHGTGMPLPGLSQLRMPDPAMAMLLACAHRWAHHRHDGGRLIWRIDLAMLWERLDASAVDRLVQHAIAHGLAALLAAGLAWTAEWTQPAPKVRRQLSAAGAREPAGRLLDPTLSDWRFDLTTTRGRLRLQVLRDYLLPDPAYLRARYAQARLRWLPWLYLRRLLRC